MIRMTFLRAALAAALPLAALPAAMAAAQTNEAQAEAPQSPAYGDLYAAMQESVDEGQMVEAALGALTREFAGTAEFAAAEAESPGLIAEVVEGLRPIFTSQSERVRQRYRPATLALFARHLSPAEATDIAGFYRSPIGRKLMAGLSRNYSPDATLSGFADESPVTREQVQADLGKATGAAMAAMTPEDMMELGRMAQAKPALLKLQLIGAGVQELRVRMEN